MNTRNLEDKYPSDQKITCYDVFAKEEIEPDEVVQGDVGFVAHIPGHFLYSNEMNSLQYQDIFQVHVKSCC